MKRILTALLAFVMVSAFAALPSSGPISFANLQTEYGGSNPIGFNEYYRNGGLVPNSGPNFGVPLSGTISLSNFYGGSNSPSGIVNPMVLWNLVSSAASSSNATLTYASDGGVATSSDAGFISSFWFYPTSVGIGASYWIQVTADSGAFTSNAASSCVSLSSARSLVKTQVGLGNSTVTFTARIYSNSGCTALVASRSGNSMQATNP